VNHKSNQSDCRIVLKLCSVFLYVIFVQISFSNLVQNIASKIQSTIIIPHTIVNIFILK
jgi:hypothetical protein